MAGALRYARDRGNVKFQLLPSTFGDSGIASGKQHLTCFVIDDTVAIDAGSLAMAASPLQQVRIRDIVLTHAHLDHIAGLPLFIDDLFSVLTEPITIHSTQSVIETLERDVFNWSVYPRFSELSNEHGPVLAYRRFDQGETFTVKHLTFRAIEVNHKVPSAGFLVSDGAATVALSGDTAEMDTFWDVVNDTPNISAILIECAFPDELEELAKISSHLNPRRLKADLAKCRIDCPIYIVNLKPMYMEAIVEQLTALKIDKLELLEVGRIYNWENEDKKLFDNIP
jgi:ribonuclease BN (tRNA processing enzyme)